MATRKVYFSTIGKNTGTGQFRPDSNPIIVDYSGSELGELQKDVGQSINTPVSPNIQITVPDNWGGMTQSPGKVEDNVIASFESKASSITLEIIYRSRGDRGLFYYLQDAFTRLWCGGEFALTVDPNSDFVLNARSQTAIGYISDISFDEFRSEEVVTGRATFVPTTPWLLSTGDPSGTKLFRFGDVQTLTGTVQNHDNMLITSYLYVPLIQNVGDTGMTFYYNDLGNARRISFLNVSANDFDSVPNSYSIIDSVIYAYKDTKGKELIGTMTVPDGLIAFNMWEEARFDFMYYNEQYEAGEIAKPADM